MHVHEFAYVRASEHVCHRMRISARLHAYACICMVARVGIDAYVRSYVVVCVRACVHPCARVPACA